MERTEKSTKECYEGGKDSRVETVEGMKIILAILLTIGFSAAYLGLGLWMQWRSDRKKKHE